MLSQSHIISMYLLIKKRDNETINNIRIAMVSGNNFQFDRDRTESSHYFPHYTHIWGCAFWYRVCNNYYVDNWKYKFENVYQRKINTWDCQLTFAHWIQSALTVTPNVNLILNIGLDAENKLSNMKTEHVTFSG